MRKNKPIQLGEFSTKDLIQIANFKKVVMNYMKMKKKLAETDVIICNRVDRTDNNRCVNCGAKSGHECQMEVLSSLTKEEMELEKLIDKIRVQTTIEAINTLKKLEEKILDENKRKSIVEEVNSFHQVMQHGFLKAAIRGVLNEYGCLKSTGESSDEFINEELITRLLMLHKIKKNE